MHTELVRSQHLTPQDVMRELAGVPFRWHIPTVSEMQQGTPDSVGRRYHELVATGVKEVRCGITVNTP